jgi:tetratricopeptide (TPR) repeat protein
MRSGVRLAPAALLVPVLWLAAPSAAELFVWVDEAGRTHVSDDPQAVPESQRGTAGQGPERGALWDDGLTGPPLRPAPGSTSRDGDRVVRLLRGAVDDLRRGETARASAALRSVLELEPGRAEAHWYLALLDRQRGRFASAEAHLRAFLAGAGDDLGPWRESARRRLAELEDERALAVTPQGESLRMLRSATPHFEVLYDAALGEAGSGYLHTVTGYLEEARARVGERLGVFPAEPTRVLFYGKGAYRRAHMDRFSFRTVGFFDGRIHVASAAHPGGELRSLLNHEYTHALFREVVGGDRPMWLNEGLAELSERASRGQPALSRGERSSLRRRIAAERWIPLARLVPGFGGLDDADARIAYLEAIAATLWIERHTDRAGRARLLVLLGRGNDLDNALRAVVSVDLAGLERALQAEILAEFPQVAPASGAE